MTDLDRLIADLKRIADHEHWVSQRIGEPGCDVRARAAEDEQTIRKAIALIQGAAAANDGS